ncbi:MAG: hypothetical protein H0X34_00445 [Chthoniobacterales bacterium]|nr:hypothetical protein [Chthoniobacterales bacterium]
MPPSAEPLPPAYQPSDYSTDITTLERLRFTPPGGGRYPAVVVAHTGGYKYGDVYGEPSQRWAVKTWPMPASSSFRLIIASRLGA